MTVETLKKPSTGWEQEVPRYRLSRALHPAPTERYRNDHPLSMQGDPDEWQYGDRSLDLGEEIETTSWPHASMMPLNESAKHVLGILNASVKSRLPRTPWVGNRVIDRPFM